MTGTYADLFSGTTYGTFNGPLYGSGPSVGVEVGYFESRREMRTVLGEEQPSPSRAEPRRQRRTELPLISAQEHGVQRRSERL